MNFLGEIFTSIFDASSIWSVVARGVIWLVIAVVIILSIDPVKPQRSYRNTKINLGILVLFIALSSTLFYFLFSFAPSA